MSKKTCNDLHAKKVRIYCRDRTRQNLLMDLQGVMQDIFSTDVTY